jgi:hypothetical protein
MGLPDVHALCNFILSAAKINPSRGFSMQLVWNNTRVVSKNTNTLIWSLMPGPWLAAREACSLLCCCAALADDPPCFANLQQGIHAALDLSRLMPISRVMLIKLSINVRRAGSRARVGCIINYTHHICAPRPYAVRTRSDWKVPRNHIKSTLSAPMQNQCAHNV